eukprot:EG_transcript_2142
MAQLNQTEQELYQTTLELMAQTKNATAQSQTLVASLVTTFGSFMQSVIAAFTVSGTDDAARLRTESALRAQLVFNDMLQSNAMALKRTAQLYDMGLLNLSRPVDQPFDDGSCTLMGSLCYPAAELSVALYLGTAGGARLACNTTGWATNQLLVRGDVNDMYSYLDFVPYVASPSGPNFSTWKQACLAVAPGRNRSSVCRHGVGMSYPSYCNGTCGFDPRCRPWYAIHAGTTVPQTRMTDVYLDNGNGRPVVTLSYPIYSSSSQLLAVAASDFILTSVDQFLSTLSSTQLISVVFNNTNLVVMGSSRPCSNASDRSSGKPIAASCDPALQALGGWMALNRNLAGNTSVELSGTLWNVFPGTVESFSYFVAVGMNKTQVYAVVTATSHAANQTLQTLSQQQSDRMAQTEADSLAQMEQLSADRIASLHAMQTQYQQYMKQEFAKMDATFNASRQQSTTQLNQLTGTEMQAIDRLEDYHLSKVRDSIGVTFGSVVGIFAGVLLCASYGTWIVARQVQRIAQVMEDVAQMRVEQLEVTQKSPIREVQRIEAALVVLVGRLAEYKTYMPAGLFQAGNEAPEEAPGCHTPGGATAAARKRSVASADGTTSPRNARGSLSQSSGKVSSVHPAPVAGCTRLMRRSAAVMAVNVVRFQAEAAQRSTGHVEGNLNRVISAVHGAASKVQGNIDAIVGDQLLVTFNAHFTCSDPSTAASTAALDVMATLQSDPAFPWHVQVGLAAGSLNAGHLGNAAFKSMVALGVPMKVASLLSHLSGFDEPAVLACPSLEERVKYTFNLQPVDLVALPGLGEHHALYAKSIIVFALLDTCRRSGTQEWMYEVGGGEGREQWTTVFREVVKAPSTDKAAMDLQRYIGDHPDDARAVRLLRRLAQWQPRVGVVLAERPDQPQGAAAGDGSVFKLPMCDL